ncbi:hypothetical protein KSS82_12320 [Vibrio mimicus]|nr:hypothetical protein [Vibrio mimicus]QXC58814.1 hypothetical protein KSS82_12320 [Vibrio mimicus]
MFNEKANEPATMATYYQRRLEQSKTTLERMALFALFELLFTRVSDTTAGDNQRHHHSSLH